MVSFPSDSKVLQKDIDTGWYTTVKQEDRKVSYLWASFQRLLTDTDIQPGYK